MPETKTPPTTAQVVRELVTRPSVNWLLVFVPISAGAAIAHQEVAAFLTAAVALVPLAALIGSATEQLAIHIGPQRGGLLNATLSNLTELIVGCFLLAAGEFTVVKATLIGSIVGNALLVLGASFAIGGSRHKSMSFSADAASVHSSSLLLAVAGLLVPALLVVGNPNVGFTQKEGVSVAVAIVLILMYMAALAFMQITHAHLFHAPARTETAKWPVTVALAALAIAAAAVALESDLLVGGLHPAIKALNIPTVFVGLILIPVAGNVAENAAAVFFAIRNRLDVTIEIAVGSSTQVALFVAPLLVFISLVLGHPMDFIFTGFEIAIVALAAIIVTLVTIDGRTNWLEGVQLLGAYLVIAITSYFLIA